MERMYPHEFEVGQRWKNESYTLYIMAVDDDRCDEKGKPCEPGKIAVTTERPFPGREFKASCLLPVHMREVILKGQYKLMEEGWMPEFLAEKQAMLTAEAAAGTKPQEITRPTLSGLGISDG